MAKSGKDEGMAAPQQRPLPCRMALTLQQAQGTEECRAGVQPACCSLPSVHVVLKAAWPAVLLVDVSDSQDAVQHALQRASLHRGH